VSDDRSSFSVFVFFFSTRHDATPFRSLRVELYLFYPFIGKGARKQGSQRLAFGKDEQGS
jgi:hypothetical protein